METHSNVLVREGRFQAEAYKIINMDAHKAISVIVSLMKQAGYEPDLTTENGWTQDLDARKHGK